VQFPQAALPIRKFLVLAPLWCCCLSGAPNTEAAADPSRAAASAIERQRASVSRQMAGLADNSSDQARQSAQASWDRQRAAGDRQRAAGERQRRALEQQRSAIGRQLASVERQLRATHPEGATFTAAAEPLAAVSWAAPGDPRCGRITPADIHPYVEEVAKRESLSPELLRVVIAHESSFLPCAVSRKGAMGMMQLMPATAAELGVANPFDPQQNIDGGARYLSYLMERFGGDLRLALAAYNAGPRRVDDYRGVPPIPETVSYVSSILRQLDSGGRAVGRTTAAVAPEPKLGGGI
jgi:soluble lytic murein transglycosylase-like protein